MSEADGSCDGAEVGDYGDDGGIRLETAPFDPRFPNTNQTKHCWSTFVDYQRCIKLRGEDFTACQYFKRVYESLCPNAWKSKWQDQLDNGTFPVKFEEK